MSANSLINYFFLVVVLHITSWSSTSAQQAYLGPQAWRDCCKDDPVESTCHPEAAVGVPNGNFYVFFRSFYAEITNFTRVGRPKYTESSFKPITDWPGLAAQTPVTLAYTWTTNDNQMKIVLKQGNQFFQYDTNKNRIGTSTTCDSDPICNNNPQNIGAAVNIRNQAIVAFYQPDPLAFDERVFDTNRQQVFMRQAIKGNITGIGIYEQDDTTTKALYFTSEHSACQVDLPNNANQGVSQTFLPFGFRPYWCRKSTDFLGCPFNLCWNPEFDGWLVSGRRGGGNNIDLHILRGAYGSGGVHNWKAPPIETPFVSQYFILGVGARPGSMFVNVPKNVDAAGFVMVDTQQLNFVFKDSQVRISGFRPFSDPPSVASFETMFTGTDFAGSIDTFWYNSAVRQMFIFKGIAFYTFDLVTPGSSPTWRLNGTKKYIGNYFQGFPRDLASVYWFNQNAYFISRHWVFNLTINANWSTNENVQRAYTPLNMFRNSSVRPATGFIDDLVCGITNNVPEGARIRQRMNDFPVVPLPRLADPFPTVRPSPAPNPSPDGNPNPTPNPAPGPSPTSAPRTSGLLIGLIVALALISLAVIGGYTVYRQKAKKSSTRALPRQELQEEQPETQQIENKTSSSVSMEPNDLAAVNSNLSIRSRL